jgi:uncharacterized membrane protein
LKDFLQGKWLRHPLHPILVHLPTALWPSAFVLDIISNLGGNKNAVVQTAFFAILLGLLAAAAAIPAGLADWWDIKPEKPARKLGVYHMSINLAVTALQTINLLLRVGTLPGAGSVDTVPLALSLLSTLMLLVSGYLGGLMVYDQGISIARLSKKRWREVAKKGGANVPQEKGG